MKIFRKHLENEFSAIYVFNLRGNARTQGEQRRKEKDNIFGSGSRAPIAITLLVKNQKASNKKAIIHYQDIGDYLTREQKLSKIRQLETVANPDFNWEMIKPNKEGDWINQRSTSFNGFISIGDKDDNVCSSYFIPKYSRGVATARDAWCYNSNRKLLVQNIADSINYYNSQVGSFSKAKTQNSNLVAEDFIPYDSKQFSWARQQKKDINCLKKYSFDPDSVRISTYRPFFKQHLYFNRQLNDMIYQMPQLFPTSESKNITICIPAPGGNKEFSALITDHIPDLHFIGDSQCFPQFYYEEVGTTGERSVNQTYLEIGVSKPSHKHIQRDGVSDFILEKARKQYNNSSLSKEDIFYYVYGVLHSPSYCESFSEDLKKMLPRVPLVDNAEYFWSFSRAGRKLAELHLNYETVPPYPKAKVSGDESGYFAVSKMRFPQKGQRDTIVYNSRITISEIPDKAYQYVVNGKSAIEWIMERYQVTTDRDSGITNDPNEWALEVGNPRYILDLLLSIINLSVQTVDILDELPEIRFE